MQTQNTAFVAPIVTKFDNLVTDDSEYPRKAIEVNQEYVEEVCAACEKKITSQEVALLMVMNFLDDAREEMERGLVESAVETVMTAKEILSRFAFLTYPATEALPN